MADKALESFIENVCGDSHLRVEADLGDGFVRLKSAEAERRQAAHDIRSTEDIVIEMLRNARDAQARNIFLAVTRDGAQRKLTMVDDGDGIPASMHERIFEPRVTSKLDTMHMDKWGVHGRGMALYSIAVNAQEARVVASDPGKGSALSVITDLTRLGEKADQSTFPSFELGDSGTVSIRGPRNILRTACEFAIECRNSCMLYLGSATDIAATLYAFGVSSLSPAARAFCSDVGDLPICKRLAPSADPSSFAQAAAALGLELSERSARRVMDGAIAPLPPLIERIAIAGREERAENLRRGASASRKAKADDRGLRFAPEDLADFSEGVACLYRDLAKRYYLDASVQPEVRAGRDGIRIFLPATKLR